MLRLVGTVLSDRRPDEIWPLVSNFVRVGEWDPSIRRVVPQDRGPIGVGSRYRVDLKAGIGTTAFDYRVVTLDPASRHAVFEGVGWLMRARDDMRVESDGRGCRVVWTVDLRPRGPLARTEPLWRRPLETFASKVIDGLRRWLPGKNNASSTVARLPDDAPPPPRPTRTPAGVG